MNLIIFLKPFLSVQAQYCLLQKICCRHRHYNRNPREMHCMLQVQTKQWVLQTSKATSGWENSTMSSTCFQQGISVSDCRLTHSHCGPGVTWHTTAVKEIGGFEGLFRTQKCFSDNKQNHHPGWTKLTAKSNTTGLYHWVFIPLYQWELGMHGWRNLVYKPTRATRYLLEQLLTKHLTRTMVERGRLTKSFGDKALPSKRL